MGISICIVLGALLVRLESDFPRLPFPLIALGLGVVVGRVRLIDTKDGATFAGMYFLRVGIVVLGLRLSLEDLRNVGGKAAIVIIPCVLLGGGIAFWVARKIGLRRRVAVLLAAGTAICGNSAIAAVAPTIGADDDEMAASIMSITLYGTAAMVLFPLLGGILVMPDQAFGMWVGTAINDTSQVVAAAFSFSDMAGEAGTVVKLARNIAIVPAVLIAPIFAGTTKRPKSGMWLARLIPWFVFAFIGAVILATVVEIPRPLLVAISLISKGFILAALIGIGIGASSLKPNRGLLLPLGAGTIAGLSLALASFMLVRVMM